jgi:hypothetical protein
MICNAKYEIETRMQIMALPSDREIFRSLNNQYSSEVDCSNFDEFKELEGVLAEGAV